MTSTETFWILFIPVFTMILVLVFGGRHHRREGERRKYMGGDPGTWLPSMSADSGHAGCDASSASGGDCGSSS